jgi:plasmid stabilization system protein ParE
VEKLKIVWSNIAVETLDEILNFYSERNKSDIYSKKLYSKIMSDVKLLARVPLIGLLTRIKNVRGLIVEDFIIYYEIKGKEVFILTIWDCSQNPEENKFVE